MKQFAMMLAFLLAATPSLAADMNQQQGSATDTQHAQLSQVDQHEVRQIQQKLQQQGYDVGRIDGLWGPQTQQALQQWQRDRGQEANGRIDAQVLAELGVEPQSQTAETPSGQ